MNFEINDPNLQKGLDLFNQGNYKKAKKPLNKYLKNNPDCCAGWCYKGLNELQVYKETQKSHDLDEALRSCTIALEIDNNMARELLAREEHIESYLYDRVKRLKQNLEYLESESYVRVLLSYSPHDPNLLLYYATILKSLRKLDAAVDVAHNVLRINPDLQAANDLINEINFFGEYGRYFYVPINYSPLFNYVKANERILYSTLAKVEYSVHQGDRIVAYKWNTHVILTPKGFYYINRFKSPNFQSWRKAQAKKRGLETRGIWFKFKNDSRFESKEEFKIRMIEYYNTFNLQILDWNREATALRKIEKLEQKGKFDKAEEIRRKYNLNP